MSIESSSLGTLDTSQSLDRDVRWAGVSFLTVTKTFDVLTTVVGLSLFPTLVERNPVAGYLISEFGLVPGLALGGVLTVVGWVVYVEAGSSVVTHLEPGERWPWLLARTVGYVPLSLFFAALAVNNAFLIGRAVAM
ncbi:MAG: hypothetical protein R3324_10125 [Halobacteriales archaeon]|nr:hypothetical protein [Halobacteriales archaeon]